MAENTVLHPPVQTATIALILLFGSALLLSQIYYFYPYSADDTFISLRYAQRMLEGKGLTWNDGERVEGYSNLLWMLLSAGLQRLGIPLENGVQLLGVSCTLLTPLAFASHRQQARLSAMALLAGITIFAVTPPLGKWALAGMETPMVMLLMACASVSAYRLMTVVSVRHALICGLMLGLICPLRPEGPLYTIAFAAGLWIASGLPASQKLRIIILIGLIPVLLFSAQLGFRLYYYHHLVSNSAMVKVAFTPERLKSGFLYVIKALFSLLPVLLYCFLNYPAIHHRTAGSTNARFVLFLLTVLAILISAILIVGGDIFTGFRAFVPLMPLITLVLMHSIPSHLSKAALKKEALFFCYIMVCYTALQFTLDVNRREQPDNWISNAKAIGKALKQKYYDKQPLIAVFAAGAIPFYSELPSLDVYGINDAALASQRYAQKRFGHSNIGHELFNGAYIESRKPDILVFDIPGFQPLCVPFKEECDILLTHYRPASLDIPGHTVTLWLRTDSDKL